ncbi:putative transcriptional regulatory protein, AraC family [gamma proteobacterium NOR5-3]|nr:putative transcriptional regulatory protein, AraC family [gamma proteobacterium NOR5-3]
MSDLLIAAIGFSLSQVLLSLLLLMRLPHRGLREKLFGLFLLSLMGYFLLPVLQGTPLSLLATTVQTAAPGVFWLLSASIFDDRFQLRAWQVGLVKFTVFMPLLGLLMDFPGSQMLFMQLPQALEFLMLGLMLWVVVRHWRTDLVESRRRLRLWFVGCNGGYLFILILTREVLFPGAGWLSVLEYLPPAVLLLAVNVALLTYRDGLLFGAGAAQASPANPSPAGHALNPAADPDLVAALQRYMEDEKPWREMGLSIGQLAAQLTVPEYRLRQAINGALGHRSFEQSGVRGKKAVFLMIFALDLQKKLTNF